jgi:LysM domain
LRFRTVVILLLAAFLLLVAPALVRDQALGRAESRVAYSTQRVSYTVRPGDTLWSIAQRIAPGRDPRPVVDQLIEDNHLQGGDLQVGQAIDLPTPMH